MVTLIFLAPTKVIIYLLRVSVYIIVFLVFKIGNKIEIIGQKNLPKGSRILFLSNHETLVDSFLIALGTQTFWDVLFYQKRFAYNVPETKNFYFNGLVRVFFETLKTVPISRSGVSRSKIEEQVNQFCKLLENDNLVIFFEGTRSRDGKIGECRIGPALTIIKARPNYVVPILLEGIESIMPIKYGSKINAHINMGNNGRMTIGKPLDLNRFYLEEYNWDDAIAKSIELRALIKKSVEDLKGPSE
jgi:1-acyl-sn-glycerol-3-phosphate acyltransferase